MEPSVRESDTHLNIFLPTLNVGVSMLSALFPTFVNVIILSKHMYPAPTYVFFLNT